MPSLNIDLDYPQHPKTVRLKALLGSQEADIYPIRLWAYLGKYHCENGDLGAYSEPEIANIAGWQGDPKTLVAAFLKVGYLERDKAGNLRAHDWQEYQGHIAAFRERSREAAYSRWGKGNKRKRKSRHASSIRQAMLKRGPSNALAVHTNAGQGSTDKPPTPFEVFWQAYPKERHVAKVAAERAWKRLNPGEKLVEIILKDIAAKAKTEDWKKQKGKFIPYPSTYLNQKRWTDELPSGNHGQGKYAKAGR